MAKWVLNENDANIPLMMQVLNVREITAYLLANRGLRTKKTALQFLNPSTAFYHDTTQMKDVIKAFGIIEESRNKRDKIVIYGDYDVDGVTSTVILTKALRALGCDVSYYIPHRETEGYGLNKNAVRQLKENETDLIITCDNGIASLEEVKLAKELGMKIIVIDHHEPGFVSDEQGVRTDVIPEADAVVNPKQQDCPYPFKLLCAAGICYKFVMALHQYFQKPFSLEKELLVFAMIATFCDVVDLIDENRIIAKTGLQYLNEGVFENIGLKAILKERLIGEKKKNAFDIGFVIGPCINATGRLERATLAVELFLCEDAEEAVALAKRLSALNTERKRLTDEAVSNAITRLLENPMDISSVIIIYDKEIHESIAGIVAGRIKEAFFHPTIVLTQGEQCAKGSARSIEAYNIFENLYAQRDLFERFGGHAMAAGLSLKEENIPLLSARLNESCTLQKEDFTEVIKIDKEIPLEEATYDLACELTTLAPYGKGNKEPLFMTKGILVEEIRVLEEKNTIIFTFAVPDTYRRIKGICFGKVEEFQRQINATYDGYTCDKIMCGILRTVTLMLDLVYTIDLNEYNNNVTVQLRIKDFKITK